MNIKHRAYNGFDYAKNSQEATAATANPGESLTVQSQAEDADINVLMHRYGITGKMPENPRIPTYGDFSEITDYRSAIEAVRRADASFMEIPARVRSQFDNDPQKFLEFCSTEGNREHMRELGLLKEVKVAPPPPPNVPPTTSGAPPTANTGTNTQK